MCTLTFFQDGSIVPGSELIITFNRDERTERAKEQAPRVYSQDGVQWLAPIDSEAGGTWMGVNDNHLVVCLLNFYTMESRSASVQVEDGLSLTSRGCIVPYLLDHIMLDQAAKHLAELVEAHCFAPFIVLMYQDGLVYKAIWDGTELLFDELNFQGCYMQTSSAWNEREVVSWREETFNGWRDKGSPFEGLLPVYHKVFCNEHPEWGTIMQRPDSSTRSITQIRLQQGHMPVMHYWPEPLHGFENPQTVAL